MSRITSDGNRRRSESLGLDLVIQTGRNVTKLRRTLHVSEFQRKDRPIPESELRLSRWGDSQRVGAAASTQAKYDGDSGYLVARAIFIDRVHIAFHSITSSARASKEGVRDQRFWC